MISTIQAQEKDLIKLEADAASAKILTPPDQALKDSTKKKVDDKKAEIKTNKEVNLLNWVKTENYFKG